MLKELEQLLQEITQQQGGAPSAQRPAAQRPAQQRPRQPRPQPTLQPLELPTARVTSIKMVRYTSEQSGVQLIVKISGEAFLHFPALHD